MTTHSTTAQEELYGESWATRFARIRAAYGLSQGKLAQTLGLSAPMVSQLASGQRVKISNPAVLARIVALEEHLTDAGVVSGDSAHLARVLEEVSGTAPLLRTTVASPTADRANAVRWLRGNGSPEDLTSLAEVATDRGAVALAAVFRDAARTD